jgi:hypothetical protein
LPLAFALRRPAFTRSTMSERSSSATARQVTVCHQAGNRDADIWRTVFASDGGERFCLGTLGSLRNGLAYFPAPTLKAVAIDPRCRRDCWTISRLPGRVPIQDSPVRCPDLTATTP